MAIHHVALSLQQATAIIDQALQHAGTLSLQPLTAVVLDGGGHVIASKREDGAGILRFDIAFGKAWGALGMGLPSRNIELISQQRPVFVSSLASVAQGRLVPVSGGVLVLNEDDEILGAVGISGDTSDADEVCAIQGIAAVNLRPLPAPAAEAAR